MSLRKTKRRIWTLRLCIEKFRSRLGVRDRFDDWVVGLGRKAFARFARTIILIPTCFLFWMIAANYYGTAIPSAAPLAATGAVLLLTNIACLVITKHGTFAHLAQALSDVRNHAVMNAAIVLAAFLTWISGTMWPDALVALGILCVNASAAEHIWLAARELPPIDA